VAAWGWWKRLLSQRLQVEHEGECFVDALHLAEGEEACGFGKPVQVDGGDLVAHHQGASVQDLDGGRNLVSRALVLVKASDPTWRFYDNKGAIYHPSEAALNMYTIDLAYELRDTAFRVNAVDPGFTSTDFNHHRGTGSVEVAATRVVKYALDSELPTGGFFSEEHNPDTAELPR